ncbi:MAG: hypothetical protein U1E38_07205 [Rhodospirillales bacterium]
MTASSGSPARYARFLALVLPLALFAGQAPAKPPPEAAATELAAAGNQFDTDQLAAVGIDTAGTLTAAEGALPVDMWRDTPRSLVDALLPRLPAGTPSPTMNRLMRRLLLTGAAAPRGDAEPGRLLDERARMLWRMGDTAGLLKLIAAVPADSRSEQLWRLDTEAQLLAGNTTAACETAGIRTDVDPDTFWQQTLGFCQALAGDADGASLTLALLVERGSEIQLYKALLEALINGRATGPKIADPDPLYLAMLRAAGLAPTMEAAAADDLPILAAIAEAGTFPEPLRLAAGERAVAAGLLPAQEIYPHNTRARSEKPLPPGRGSTGRAEGAAPGSTALMHEAIATVNGNRVERAAAILEASRQRGDWLEATHMVLPWIVSADPSSGQPALARTVVPALLVQGERARAEAWLDQLAAAAASGDNGAGAALAALMPLARLARLGRAQSWNPDSLIEWWQAEKAQPGARLRAARLLAMLQATGDPVPDSLWHTLLGGPAQMSAINLDAAFRVALVRASKAGKLGETVLLALVGLGADGPQALGTSSMEVTVDSLRTAGLPADARALALEAVAAR